MVPVAIEMTRTQRSGQLTVELLKHRGGYALHYLYLLGCEVLPPAPRGRLAVELALPLLLLGDVLPGVFLHDPAELFFVHKDPERGVKAFQRGQSVYPELLVLDHRLRPLVSLVGFSGTL